MSVATIIFFSIIVIALIAYFVFYKRNRAKDVVKLLNEDAHIENITYDKGDLSMEFQRKGETWQMVQPEIWEVVPEKMRRLILKLVTLDIERSFSAANAEKEEYGIGKNGELTLDGSERVAISIGTFYPQDEELIYIRKTDERGVSLVSASLLQVLPGNVAEYRNMKFFDGVPSQVSSLEAGSASGAFLLVRTEQEWIMSGRNMFDEKVKPFLEAVLSLEAEDFLTDSSYKLSPKPEVYIILKINKKTITRNFFPFDDENFITPVEAKLLKIKKSAVAFVFNFK